MTRLAFLLHTILNLCQKCKLSEFCLLNVIVNACLLLQDNLIDYRQVSSGQKSSLKMFVITQQ